MTVDELIAIINTDPENLQFTEVISVIEENYNYRPTRFQNGAGSRAISNDAGSNEGSCKIFAFGKLHGLDKQQTLACFGNYYREDVRGHPKNDDHANIRNFMQHGWEGIRFDSEALLPLTGTAERVQDSGPS